MTHPEMIMLGAQALNMLDSYNNLVMTTQHCECGATLIELYRSDPAKQEDPYIVVRAEGENVWEALVAANAALLQTLDEHNQRQAEITDLEKLFHESDARHE